MATLYQTVNDDLPTTSSLKMIDIWMLFALAIPFMEVILHTAMAWIRQKYEWKTTSKVVGIAVGNQTNEIYGREVEVKFGLQKNVVKRLVTVATTTKEEQDQPGEMNISTNEPKMRKIAWDQQDERTWPKSVLRYFVHYHSGSQPHTK